MKVRKRYYVETAHGVLIDILTSFKDAHRIMLGVNVPFRSIPARMYILANGRKNYIKH